MNLDSAVITDPPDFPTRYEPDDLPEALGDEFEFTVEEKAKIHRAANPNLVTRALAGDQEGFEAIRRLHVTLWHHDRGMR